MAKDVNEKTPVSSSNSDNNSPPTSDQQRVPPLRIVLNVSGNQKSSSASGAGSTINQDDSKREKTNDTKTDTPTAKPGGKVRIKLGTGKPANRNSNNSASQAETQAEKTSDESQKSRLSREQQDYPSTKDDTSINYSHLRRITRRSQRTIQTISNEDEESISSMISTDENQNSNSNNTGTAVNNSDSNGASQDSAPVTSATTLTTSASSTNGGSSSAADTPRRKRKKGESITEPPLIDYENTFNFQNYRISVQNSFELFKNIRKHVDEKLKTLSSVHPRAPHGFKDYMLTRGAYLLDGNKLGNGTNLFMNEDGGLNPAPIGKYHVLRHNRVNYTVPNRAKVPLGLPVNSPLYNLFIDQEKERYRMQIQHIKEREKLTLAVEQEIMRVYNQAAMSAVNQDEPFSACTMLKHQEIYNYLDSEGSAILASEDARLDQVKPSEGVRTRRRQHEQITSPSRKTSTTSRTPTNPSTVQKSSSDPPVVVKDESSTDGHNRNPADSKDEVGKSPPEKSSDSNDESAPKDHDEVLKIDQTKHVELTESTKESDKGIKSESSETQVDDSMVNEESKSKYTVSEASEEGSASKKAKTELVSNSDGAGAKSDMKSVDDSDSCKETGGQNDKSDEAASASNEVQEEIPATSTQNPNQSTEKEDTTESMDVDDESKGSNKALDEQIFTEDDVKAYNREVFLSQLQGIDDKWEQVRAEMLIRHRNEAESLYAVQKLEWEWKTKEIGACDVRMTPIIDETLVPKLNIYSQDY